MLNNILSPCQILFSTWASGSLKKNSKARELTQLHDVQRCIFCIFRKISAQPHTSLCKHILIMIHWIKKPHVWMHNEVWGCAEILPNWPSSILPEAMSKTKKNLWKIAQWMLNSEFGLKWKLMSCISCSTTFQYPGEFCF